MTQLKTSLSEEANARLRRGEVITELLMQYKHEPSPIEEQVLYLYALKQNILDALTNQMLKKFKKEIRAYAEDNYKAVMDDFRKTWDLTDPVKKGFDEILRNYFSSQKKSG